MTSSLGKDLARSQGTDFYRTDELLTDDERDIRDRVRTFVDERLIPAAAGYWERAEFPHELVSSYAELGVAGGALSGFGCPGMSALAEGLVTLELARGDGSISTFNSVHSGLAMTTIGLLGSDEQKQRWWVPKTRVTSSDLLMLVEQSAESVTPPDGCGLGSGAVGQRS